MKNEFKEALNDMQNLILDMNKKYHFKPVDLKELWLQMNKIAMLAPTGTFEEDEKMKTHKIKLLLNFCDDVEKHCLHFKDKSRFVELPCKVGDKAYYLSIKRAVPLTYKIEQAEVLNYNINRYGIFDVKIRQLNSDYIFRTSIDKIYFTKEEAEAKLKELEK